MERASNEARGFCSAKRVLLDAHRPWCRSAQPPPGEALSLPARVHMRGVSAGTREHVNFSSPNAAVNCSSSRNCDIAIFFGAWHCLGVFE
eukprot:6181979-Pleurochrysis_carterae.AAC.2